MAATTAISIGVLVPMDRIARVIGKSGSGLKQIRGAAGCTVQAQKTAGPTGARRVDLTGLAEQVAWAAALVLQKAHYDELSTTASIMIPANKAGVVVGSAGANLKRVRGACGVRIQLEREEIVDPVTGAQERLMTVTGVVGRMPAALQMALGTASADGLCLLQVAAGRLRQSSGDPDEVQLHMCVPGRLAGAILGKGGARVKETATAAGCHVAISSRDPNCADRSAVIAGTFAQCVAAQKILYDQLTEAAAETGSELKSVSVTLFVQKEAAGAVIGKGAEGLKLIREESGTRVNLARDEVKGMRPCTIIGPMENVLEAERLVVERGREEIADGGSAAASAGATREL